MRVICFLIFVSLFIAVRPAQLLGAVSRDNDPVVIKGNNLSCLTGLQPTQIVAYQFNGTDLIQIPVQVDEVVIKPINTPYNYEGCAGSSTLPWNIAFYADANTYTGTDTNTLFDEDDELVFMAGDAGVKLDICPPTPAGCVSDTTCEMELRDPLDNTLLGYVYLFEQDGTLDQNAGADYVMYDFTYAGNYLSVYDVCDGDYDENSTVTTADYNMKYTRRWVEEELKISAGTATSVDILDRHQAFVAPNNCFRSEDTFSGSRGNVVTSTDGPVRAVRSVMGANSGIFTQTTTKFTKSRVDYEVNFRVHPIGGYFDVYDLSPAAVGMTYYNDQNPGGVAVDGVQDAIVTTNYNLWELYTGGQGSLAVSYDFDTDIVLGTLAEVEAGTAEGLIEAYYDDRGSPAGHTCTGDGAAYGSSGFHLLTGVCTDYWAGGEGCGTDANYFTGKRYHYILSPGATSSDAAECREYAMNPISAIASEAPLSSFCTSTGIGDKQPATPPVLSVRSYPNPFNPVATIVYTIPAYGFVSLRIYDVNGRHVQTLVNEFKAASTHAVTWSGTNEAGESVTSGIYFVYLESGGQALTRKVLLLK